jgi:hypothetical protein
MSDLIALTGYARVGKDEAAKALIGAGWVRRCFGDVIKGQVDQLVRQHLGYSAFTEDDTQKKQIRGLLEQWGDSNYAGVMREFFGTLPDKCVNTRLCRVLEALEWRRRGGLIVHIQRVVGPDQMMQPASTPWEESVVHSLWSANVIDYVLVNDGSTEDLKEAMRRLFILNEHERVPASAGNRPGTIWCSRFVHSLHR